MESIEYQGRKKFLKVSVFSGWKIEIKTLFKEIAVIMGRTVVSEEKSGINTWRHRHQLAARPLTILSLLFLSVKWD